MASDLDSRKSTSKSEAFLKRKFAELCARIRRVDLVAALLVVLLAVLIYAFVMGLFDLLVPSNELWVSLFRWSAYAVFLGLFGYLSLRAVRCAFRRVSPYYVAHQLEETLPDAKNALINWLDLHDEDLPAAFRKNLSVNAAEQFKECDPEPTIRKRRNGIALGILILPTLGLLVLLLLGPSAFFASMQRAFLPFWDTQRTARTAITLLSPESSDVEVSPTQAIAFAARIEGRVPASNRPDAPKLLYRYLPGDDFLVQPLVAEGDNVWTTQLLATQLRTGFTWKITAGDRATDEHQVRVRARAHVQKFEITYHHRPYRKLPRRTSVFPQENAATPFLHGPRGTEVEMRLRTSRPVQKATVELVAGTIKKELPLVKVAGDARTFTCRWTLEQPGHFRVLFTSTDGEENTDREACPIDVTEDELPRVVLTQPGKNTSLPTNGILELEGVASSPLGLKNLILQLRVAKGPDRSKLQAKIYREGKSFQSADGVYPDVVEYQDFVALDELKDEKGTIRLLPAETVLEYWLEATDSADYPQPTGNVGKSLVYQVTLLPALKDTRQQQVQRQKAQTQQKSHEKKQDERLSKENADRARNPGAGSSDKGLEEQANNAKQETQDTKNKLDKAQQEQGRQQQAGGAKGGEQNPAEPKPGPQNASDGPEPRSKDQKPMSPGDAGSPKEQGGGESGGEAKDGSGKENDAKGERKDGPKESSDAARGPGPMEKAGPAGGAKDGGPTGMNAPPMPQPKDNTGAKEGPTPQAKQGAKNDAPEPGSAKADEPGGPELPNKGATPPLPPTNATAKAGMMTEGKTDPKQAPPEQAHDAGNARGDEGGTAKKEPTWDDLARLIEQLPQRDPRGDKAGKDLADIAAQAGDERKRDLARESLEKNQRDPGTGKPIDKKADPGPETKSSDPPVVKDAGNTSRSGKEEIKGPSLFGSSGKSPGISDAVKAAAANREFARRIGQMQLDDWKKRLTPDVRKKAGISEAEWQQFVSKMQTYDALVRQLNAKKALADLREVRKQRPEGSGPTLLQGANVSDDLHDGGHALPPPELRDAQRRFSTRQP